MATQSNTATVQRQRHRHDATAPNEQTRHSRARHTTADRGKATLPRQRGRCITKLPPYHSRDPTQLVDARIQRRRQQNAHAATAAITGGCAANLGTTPPPNRQRLPTCTTLTMTVLTEWAPAGDAIAPGDTFPSAGRPSSGAECEQPCKHTHNGTPASQRTAAHQAG